MDLHPGEEIVFEGHPSWRGVLSFYVYGIGAAVIVGIVVGVDRRDSAIGSIVAVVGHRRSSSSSASCERIGDPLRRHHAAPAHPPRDPRQEHPADADRPRAEREHRPAPARPRSCASGRSTSTRPAPTTATSPSAASRTPTRSSRPSTARSAIAAEPAAVTSGREAAEDPARQTPASPRPNRRRGTRATQGRREFTLGDTPVPSRDERRLGARAAPRRPTGGRTSRRRPTRPPVRMTAASATAIPLYERYHDEEWGRPGHRRARPVRADVARGVPVRPVVADDPAQARGFRAAFANFEPEAVARFGDDDVERLLADAGIVRNRAKIEATIANARATVALHEDGGTLRELIWEHRPRPATRRRRRSPTCPRRHPRPSRSPRSSSAAASASSARRRSTR